MAKHINLDYAKVAMKLASLLGRKYSVNIIFSGDEAKTDGETIYLPHWDFKDPRKRNALYGLIFHEAAGHVRFTDFHAVSNRASARVAKSHAIPVALYHAASNILEDIRIERLGLLAYPGARSFLNSVCDVVFEDYPAAKDQTNHWSLALNWSILTFRSRILGQTILSKLADEYDEVAVAYFGTATLQAAISIAEKAAISPDTASVLDLGEQLIELFDQAIPKQPEQPQAPQQQGGDQSQDGQQDGSDGDQSQDGQQDGSDGDQSQDGQQGGSDSDQSQDGQQDGSDGDQPQDGQQGGSSSSQNKDAKPPKPLSKDTPATAQYDVAKNLAEKAKAPDGGPVEAIGYVQPMVGPDAKGNTQNGYDDVSSSLRQAIYLRQGIVGAVSPMLCGDSEYSEVRRHGRSIDPRQLTRVKTDVDPRIWRTLQIDDDQSVAVQILIDTSSSTNINGVLVEERKAALALASALEQFPLVETAISHFPAQSSSGQDLAPLLKPFHRPLSLCLKGWPRAKGGTPLDEAYRASGYNFFLSDKERRILFVLTDGKPDDQKKVTLARDWLGQLGVEVYGVVIGQQTFPRQLFDDSIIIQNATELPRAIMDLVKRHL